MPASARTIIDVPLHDDLAAAVDAAIQLSDGDPRSAIAALILGQRSLQEAIDDRVSAGYVRRRPAGR